MQNSSNRKDLISECKDDLKKKGLPVLADANFKEAYCDRCLQPECVRANSQEMSSFELKAKTWQNRLFNPVVLKDKSNEAVAKAMLQKFISVDVPKVTSVHLGGSSVQSGWIDPLNPTPETPEVVEKPKPKPAQRKKTSKKKEEVVSAEATEPKAQPPQTPAQGFNTPRQTGILLPGATAQEGSPQRQMADSWSVNNPQPVESGVRVVKPGAKLRF